MEKLLSIQEVSAWLNIPVQTLYNWRNRGEGPPAMRIGRWLRYRESDVQTWLDARAART